MKKYFLFLFILISTTSFSQSSLSWYKMLKGKMGNYRVTMHLHKYGKAYSGFLYHDSIQQPVYFAGEDSTKKGIIQLMIYGDDAENFNLTWAGGKLKGEWILNEVKKRTELTEAAGLPVRFQYIFTEGYVPLRPKMKNSPNAFFHQGTVWPATVSGDNEFIRNEILRTFSSAKQAGEIGAELIYNKKEFFKVYRKGFTDVSDEDLENSASGYTYDQTEKLMVVYQSDKLLSLGHNWFTYMGGAHGMYGTSYSVYDMVSKKKLFVEDILNTRGIEQLPGLLGEKISDKFKSDKNGFTMDDLLVDTIHTPDNFFVTGKGIGFVYAPYEIGSYAMGEIIIFFPFRELTAFLRPDFKKLLNP